MVERAPLLMTGAHESFANNEILRWRSRCEAAFRMGNYRTAAFRRQQPNVGGAGPAVKFRRRRDLPGVELRIVEFPDQHGVCEFCSYCSDFEFYSPLAFRGEWWHQRRWLAACPGRLLALGPGDLFRARCLHGAGSLAALIVEKAVLGRHLAEHGLTLEQLRLALLTAMSAALRARFLAAIESLQPTVSLLETEANLGDFLAALLVELGQRPAVPESTRYTSDAAVQACQRLQGDTTGSVDLQALADETGLSRFQLLRAFKRRFGLPPQTYRLQMRIGLARKMLRDGVAPAWVAAELGFVDQSHMTRHFKRALGLTPAKYAKNTKLS